MSLEINDLSYLESFPENQLILLGSAGVQVTAYSSSYGDNTYTSANVNVSARELRNGRSTARGSGTAMAIGSDPTAGVMAAGNGDVVRAKSRSRSDGNTAHAWGSVVAQDFD